LKLVAGRCKTYCAAADVGPRGLIALRLIHGILRFVTGGIFITWPNKCFTSKSHPTGYALCNWGLRVYVCEGIILCVTSARLYVQMYGVSTAALVSAFPRVAYIR